MENAVEAIKMAFAVIVFGMALTISVVSFNSVKATSDIVLYTKDETNYYDYQGAIGKAAENRIVGLETIIPTLYKYYKENYTVVFRQGIYDETTGEFYNLRPLEIYTTPSKSKTSTVQLWGSNYDTIMKSKYDSLFDNGYNESLSTSIFSFDLEEESLRHEPWTGSFDKARENLDCMLSGSIYKNPNNNSDYINYSRAPLQIGGFISKYNNTKFVETIGEYTYSSSQGNDTEEGSSISSLINKKNKRIIIFTKINN